MLFYIFNTSFHLNHTFTSLDFNSDPNIQTGEAAHEQIITLNFNIQTKILLASKWLYMVI